MKLKKRILLSLLVTAYLGTGIAQATFAPMDDTVTPQIPTGNSGIILDIWGIPVGGGSGNTGTTVVIPEGADPCQTIGTSIAHVLKETIEGRVPLKTVTEAVYAAGAFEILGHDVNLSKLYALDMASIASEAVKVVLDEAQKAAAAKIDAEFKRALGNGLNGFNYTNADWSADVKKALGI